MAFQWAVEVPGLESLTERLGEFADVGIMAAMLGAAEAAGEAMAEFIRTTKLLGQVLHYRSGTLFHSIGVRVVEIAGNVLALVGTAVIYSRIHEFGGVIHHTNLFGRGIVADIRMPKRPYFAPSVLEFGPTIPAFFERYLEIALTAMGTA